MKRPTTPKDEGALRKQAASPRPQTLRRIDSQDRLEASSDLRTDQTFLRCGGPRRMKRADRP